MTPLSKPGGGPLADLRELEAALEVQPSPAFAARVRARVAALPSPASNGLATWGTGRAWGAALAGAAVVVVVLMVLPILRSPVQPDEPQRAALTEVSAVPAAGGVELGPVPTPIRSRAPRARAVNAAGPGVVRAPLVQVSGDEARALDRLLFALSAGTVVVPEFSAEVDSETGALLPPAPIVVVPIIDVKSLPIVRDGAAGRTP